MVAHAAERLVRDRFGEFQNLARNKNTLPQGPTDSRTPAKHWLAKDVGGKPTFMREFFESIGKIQATLNQGRANVKLMESVLEESLQATTQDKQKEVSGQLRTLAEDTKAQLQSIKDALQQLNTRSQEEEKLRPNSAEGRIRVNMQQAVAKKHQQLLVDFQKVQFEYKQSLERRQMQEMEILMPDATSQERADMIEAGENSQLIVARRMAGAHALLLDEVQQISEKHQDILRIEASINDLVQMFEEMALLVKTQGEMLDAIEMHVHKAKDCTAKAEVQLQKAKKYQSNTRKWMCCLMVVLMVVVLSILCPLLIKSG